jgi:signal transduction histidine kinase
VDFETLNEERFRIKFTDSGPGIPPEIVDKLMQPFFTTKGPGKGTGLGLSISKGIIESHDGKFYVDQNSPNTCFVIELPYKQSMKLKIAA